MLKQVLAGQYGLTFMATMYFAMVCGRPVDFNMGWDATSRLGRKMLYMDLQNEDPYCTVLTPPCGPRVHGHLSVWPEVARLERMFWHPEKRLGEFYVSLIGQFEIG